MITIHEARALDKGHREPWYKQECRNAVCNLVYRSANLDYKEKWTDTQIRFYIYLKKPLEGPVENSIIGMAYVNFLKKESPYSIKLNNNKLNMDFNTLIELKNCVEFIDKIYNTDDSEK